MCACARFCGNARFCVFCVNFAESRAKSSQILRFAESSAESSIKFKGGENV